MIALLSMMFWMFTIFGKKKSNQGTLALPEERPEGDEAQPEAPIELVGESRPIPEIGVEERRHEIAAAEEIYELST